MCLSSQSPLDKSIKFRIRFIRVRFLRQQIVNLLLGSRWISDRFDSHTRENQIYECCIYFLD